MGDCCPKFAAFSLAAAQRATPGQADTSVLVAATMQPRAESRKSLKSVPPPHAHLVKFKSVPPPHPHLVPSRPNEDVPTTKFARAEVDVDDTVPVELYSRPYERVEVESTRYERLDLQRDSRPYELLEIEQEIEFSTSFDLAAPDEIAAEVTDHVVSAPALSIATRLFFALLLLSALATGFCLALLVS